MYAAYPPGPYPIGIDAQLTAEPVASESYQYTAPQPVSYLKSNVSLDQTPQEVPAEVPDPGSRMATRLDDDRQDEFRGLSELAKTTSADWPQSAVKGRATKRSLSDLSHVPLAPVLKKKPVPKYEGFLWPCNPGNGIPGVDPTVYSRRSDGSPASGKIR